MKTAFITGGSRGIGFASAKLFSAHGYNTIITGRNESELEVAMQKIGKDRSRYIVWDVKMVNCAEDVLRKAHNFFGDIQVFINNAGIVSPKGIQCGSFPNINECAWDAVMDINLKGTVFFCQEEAKYMIAHGIRGHIVNVCSEMGFRAAYDAYCISKWGIRGFTMGAAKTLAKYGIVMNGIAPGETATTLLGQEEGVETLMDSPRGKRAMPQEIAEEILFLASRRNIIGEILISDGGRSLN